MEAIKQRKWRVKRRATEELCNISPVALCKRLPSKVATTLKIGKQEIHTIGSAVAHTLSMKYVYNKGVG